MKICFATSECVPFVKTGGLADVSGALPKALANAGCEIKLFLPLYSAIDAAEHGLLPDPELRNLPVQIGPATVYFTAWFGRLPGSEVEVYLIENHLYFDRKTIYTDEPDEDDRFILFQHAVLQVLQRLRWAPDVLHCNDWQTGLLPALMQLSYKSDALFANTATLFTIHNIEYQGWFPANSVAKAGLPASQFYPGGPLEAYGQLCNMKTGIVYSDAISTVSETYAREIQTSAYGAGMEGILSSRKADLTGILNGIDVQIWNPSQDKLIPFRYSSKDLENKKKNKVALQKYAGLPQDEDVAVLGMISRLASQKGLDLLKPILSTILKLPLQLVVLGSGDAVYEKLLLKTTKAHPEKCFVYLGFNNELAHLITAGADMFVMPSRYEPCGLNQMYSLNYGTVPIVRRTGGLADTVHDFHEYYGDGTGFSFYDYKPDLLRRTILRALDIYKDRQTWREIMLRAMKADFSWRASARKYLEIYKRIAAAR